MPTAWSDCRQQVWYWNVQLFCFWFQCRGEVEPVHQATSTDGPANACTSHASDCELNEWLEFRTLNENMSAFPCEIIQDLECTIDWAEYREDALY